MKRGLTVTILGAVLLGWTAAVYLPARNFDFVNWDDFNEVTENPLLNPPTTAHLGQIWSGPYLKMYTPLTYTTWWAAMKYMGATGSPVVFHLINIALHLAAVALVFSILVVCLKSPWAALGGAAVFALHPVQVESVAWVSEMNNLLATALALGAIRLYLAFRICTGRARWVYFSVASAVYVLALLAKPTAVMTPVIAGLLDWGFLRASAKWATAGILPWLVAAGVFAWIAHASQDGPATAIWRRPVVMVDALAFYYGKLLWPMGLSIDYGRTPGRVIVMEIFFGDLAIVAVLVGILWLLKPNHRGVVVGAVIMFAGLLPVLGLMPFRFQEYSTVADHFLYLAMLGPALAIGALLATAPRWAGIPVGVGLAVALTVLTVWQLPVWRNSDTLATQALKLDPGSAIGNDIVGAELDRDEHPSLAIPHFERAIVRDPTNPEFHYNLGNALFRLSEYRKSIVEFEIAVPLFDPPSWKAMNNLGVAYAKVGRRADAMEEFKRVLAIDPDNSEAMRNLQVLGVGVPSR
jgi:protein O-mannosyl-transferase